MMHPETLMLCVLDTPVEHRPINVIFSVIIDPLSRLLETHKNIVFTCVGALNLSEFPELSPFLDRIEIRPLVPLNELSSELASFDINLAPLEVNNPFCEAKSELKYFEAGSVGVPTVASSTSTMVNAIVDGVTGFCANDGRQWLERLTTLVAEPELRRVLGRSARQHCIVEYGPEAMSDSIRAALIGLTKQQNC
jgi:glycosyltransferase involved in cell wall biosynthesis